MDEVRQRGLTCRTQQPPDKKCEFCGKVLRHEGLVFFGIVMWNPAPERCTCQQAQKKWAEYDAEEARKKKEAELAERRARMEAKINRLLGKSGIKKRFQQRTFETFRCDTRQRKAAYDVARSYAEMWDKHFAEGTGLYIEGTNGTGKTHLAAAIAIYLIKERRVPVICKTSGDMLLDIKNTFDYDGATEKQVLDVYKRVDLLIVDDLGKEQCTDWSISTLYSILNDRYEEMKPTIITTNYNSEDLARALTPKGFDNQKVKAIISRLREVSQVLTMAWGDARERH